ncbi:hypothetical protein BIY24_10245 [Halobacteriovorax marinus]|uniref:DUF4339 domain-containing protein n=1 Tax=Halobacteriovorax marinus TaxID=97084 RepID=UPI000BC3232C|nr:DUF4339 domain-containing protein [Halobacteriovorax marinus]ATH08314.1 hypothetical protein BIY24_10245 [Halobacteriovorax marinus]
MEKTWFIFQSDHHLGPFTTDEILQMLQNGRIDEEVPLWKEGEEDWRPLGEFEQFLPKTEEVLEDSSFPEIPDLPDIPAVSEVLEDLEVLDEPDLEAPGGSWKEATLESAELPDLPEVPFAPVEEIVEFSDEFAGEVIEENTEEVAEEIVQEATQEELPSLPALPDLPEAPEHPEYIEEDLDEMPSLPVDEEASEPVEEFVAEAIEEVSSETLVEVKEVVESERQIEDEEIGELEEVDEVEDEEDVWAQIDEQTSKGAPNYKFIAACAACFTIFILSMFLIYQSTRSSINLDDFSPLVIDKVEEIRKKPFKENVFAEIFMSKNSKDLMLATNIKHNAKIYLTLTSVQKRVVSEEQVVASAQASLVGGVAKFSKIKIVKGSRFASGEYYVQLLAIPVGVEHRAYKYLYSKFEFNFFKPSEQLRYRGKSLIYPGTLEDFEKELVEFKDQTRSLKAKPLKHLIEGYKTFSTLSSKIYKIYEDVLTSIRRGKEIESFEILYSKNVGPVLQGLILETHKLSKEYEISNPEIFNKYSELLEQGKRIGEMASDMVTMTKKIKRLRKNNRNRLMKLFIKRSLFLQETSKTKLSELEKELNSYK